MATISRRTSKITHSMNLRMEPELRRRVEAVAARKRLSASHLIREVMRMYVEDEEASARPVSRP
jgi:predicted HicB family RNase H-like nuclease